MHRALIRKELFQCSGFCLIALMTCAALPYWLSNPYQQPIRTPFLAGFSAPIENAYTVADVLVGNFSLVGGVLGIVLGLTQTAWESIAGTWHFLLYRPASRRKILAIKLITGSVLLMFSTAIPGMVYGLWASTPGTHSSPFGWWMTEKFWQQWMTIPVMYLAACQSGLLDARWYGTRLLPIVAAGAFCMFLAFVPYWWFVGLPLLLICLIVQLVSLFHFMQTHDFA